MKNLLFASAAIVGLSLSFVYANDEAFLERIEKSLFNEDILTPAEKGKLLFLSSEKPQETIKVSTEATMQARRSYGHVKLRARIPFYQKRIERIVDEPSIDIVKRKDRVSREKALRYRDLFTK